jgi:hypothetical protein
MKLTQITTGLALLAFVGTASALPYNAATSRPATIGSTPAPELSLQEVMDATFGSGQLSATDDQSTAAAWTGSDAGTGTAYSIEFMTSGLGSLFIYSLADNSKVFDLGLGGTSTNVAGTRTTNPVISTESSFRITDEGYLLVGGSLVDTGWTDLFGFYYETGTKKSYTEDDMNDGSVKALTYQLSDLDYGYSIDLEITSGSVISVSNSGSLNGNDDWLIAFEDGTDNDYNDAVFLIQDISAVPEPSVITLFGLGLIGLGFASRKKKQA